jgi:hypothetical protein
MQSRSDTLSRKRLQHKTHFDLETGVWTEAHYLLALFILKKRKAYGIIRSVCAFSICLHK